MVKLDDKAQWLKDIRRMASPNFDDRPEGVDICLLVIHAISLPPGEFGTSCIEQLFCNTLDPDAHPYFEQLRGLEVSAHMLIERSGEIIQFVPFHKRAWHAVDLNSTDGSTVTIFPSVSSWKAPMTCHTNRCSMQCWRK